MNNTELKALVEKCNAYIASKFTTIRHPRVQIDSFGAYTSKYEGRRPAESIVWCMTDRIEVKAEEVYRRNATSENCSISVCAFRWCENNGTTIASIKFRADQKWETMTRKMDAIIAAATEAQDNWTPEEAFTHYEPGERCQCTWDVFNYYNKDEAIAKIQSLTDLHFNVFTGEQTLEAQVALQVAEVEKLFA